MVAAAVVVCRLDVIRMPETHRVYDCWTLFLTADFFITSLFPLNSSSYADDYLQFDVLIANQVFFFDVSKLKSRVSIERTFFSKSSLFIAEFF